MDIINEDKNTIVTVDNAAASYSNIFENLSSQESWVKLLDVFYNKIIQLGDKVINIGKEGWLDLTVKFRNYRLLREQKQQYIGCLVQLLEYDSNLNSSQKCLEYVSSITKKIGCLQKKIHSNHTNSLYQFKYLVEQTTPDTKCFLTLKFDLSEQEVLGVAARVRELFPTDQTSFAILILYLWISVQNQLKTTPYYQVATQYQNILNLLEQKYPPTNQIVEMQTFIFEIEVLKNLIGVVQPEAIDKQDQLDEHEKQDFWHYHDSFKDIMKYMCDYDDIPCQVQSFSHRDKQLLHRTVSIMLKKEQSINKMFEINLNSFKNINQEKVHSSQEEVAEMIVGQMVSVQNSIKQIIDQLDYGVNIDSILIGRCFFSKPQQLVFALKKYASKEDSQNKYQVIGFKNNLGDKSRDVMMVIRVNDGSGWIFSLQLLFIQSNTESSFNRRILEVKETLVYTHILHLFTINRKYSKQYFTNIIQISQKCLPIEKDKSDKILKVSFSEIEQGIKQFKDKILMRYGVEYSISKQKDQQQKQAIIQLFQTLLSLFDSQQNLSLND